MRGSTENKNSFQSHSHTNNSGCKGNNNNRFFNIKMFCKACKVLLLSVFYLTLQPKWIAPVVKDVESRALYCSLEAPIVKPIVREAFRELRFEAIRFRLQDGWKLVEIVSTQ